MSNEPPEILLVGDPLEVISFTLGGRTSRATRRGFALLWEFERRAQKRWPGCVFRIVQPAFNTGVTASAGTHDKADVWDWVLDGVDNWRAESNLARACGLADWVRDPSQGFAWHHHAVGRGLPLDMYGDLVPGQLVDYGNHALGLRGGHAFGSDPQCFTVGQLTHTVEPIFNYAQWKQDNMQLDPAQIAEIADKAVAKLLATELTLSDGSVVDVQQAFRRAAQVPAQLIEAERDLATDIAGVKAKVGSVLNAVKVVDDQVNP